MAFSLVQSKEGTVVLGGISVTLPSNPTVGNLLVCSCMNLSSVNSPNVGNGSGTWIVFNFATRPASTHSIWLYVKYCQAGESPTIGIEHGAGEVVTGAVYEFSGGPYTTDHAQEAFGSANGAAATTSVGVAPSVVAPTSGALVFSSIAWNGAVTTPVNANGTFTAGKVSAVGNICLADSWKLSTVGVTYNDGFNWTNSLGWVQITTIIKLKVGAGLMF